MSRVLFILKRRLDYNAIAHSHIGMSTGLYNSANFMNEMLNEHGVDSDLFVAVDNNCIDREVTRFKPTHVIIEALWVVPTKFAILSKLHPDVTWVIRIHSEMPFMAGEGSAMDWIGDYSSFKNIIISCNAPRMLKEISTYLRVRNNWTEEETARRVVYLPNYYPQEYKQPKLINHNKDWIDIGCFGAIRPLKNHLLQAHAALEFCQRIGKQLRFHVNAGRIEMQGQPAINNLKGMFEQLYDSGARMINHQWRPREEFLELCKEMDIGMQCNFSETFNIVGADLISQGIPIVGSYIEIPWAPKYYCADANNSMDIADKLELAYNNPELNVRAHQHLLSEYTTETSKIWHKYFTQEN